MASYTYIVEGLLKDFTERFQSVLWDSHDKGHGSDVGVPNKRS